MGQKVHPHGQRVGVIKDWDTRWYANKKDFADNLLEDYKIRNFLKKKLYAAGISRIEIERAANRVTVNIVTGKPGVVIGRGGAGVEQVKKDVEKLRNEQQTRNRALQNAYAGLKQQRDRQKDVVERLKGEEKHLKDVLAEQNSRAEALDRELDRLIRLEEERAAEAARKERERKLAEERRKAEEQARLEAEQEARVKAEKDKAAKEKAAKEKAAKGKASKPSQKNAVKNKKGASQPEKKPKVETPKPDLALKPSVPVGVDDKTARTINFENSKGKLPYPVSGKCRVVRTFGRQRHPELRHVMTDNGGIDIEAAQGAEARAVAAGQVSAVFSQPGYGMVVMVRHGHYLTIYVGLESLAVSNGATVKAGQTLGTVANDSDGSGKALLHFEIRREKTKLNPLDWLR